jgi:hypothetical protein
MHKERYDPLQSERDKKDYQDLGRIVPYEVHDVCVPVVAQLPKRGIRIRSWNEEG